MTRLLIAVQHLIRDERGQDLIEYGLLGVLIAAAAVVALGTVGDTINKILWIPLASAI
jgi:Flp pilus assembly pilin Flp